MAKFDEVSVVTKIGVLLIACAIVAAGFYFWQLGPLYDEIKQVRAQVADKKAENERLRQFIPKLAALDKHLVELEQQLVEEKRIVPDDKEAEDFIKLLHDTAAAAGVEIRRYTAVAIANHEFYSDEPFQLDLDGSYFSLLNFFDRVGKLERIVNISSLQMSNTKTTGPSKVKTTYPYRPSETVVASCTATTFFSHDLTPPADKPATVK
jgi:type IV pilus assembly protein PilO